MYELMTLNKKELAQKLWEENPRLGDILQKSSTLKEARENLFKLLEERERRLFKIHSKSSLSKLNMVEKKNAKSCIATLKNCIRTQNETVAGFSALEALWQMKRGTGEVLESISCGFLAEFITLMRGMQGKADFYSKFYEKLKRDSRKASADRSGKLDSYSETMEKFSKRYTRGTDRHIIRNRRKTRKLIMDHFEAGEKDWQDYKWHIKNIISSEKELSSIVKLEADEIESLRFAELNDIPFQITPYYLSLFNSGGRTEQDRVLRAQVIPSMHYCRTLIRNREKGLDTDFMDEKSTSPIPCITRRYPQIVILKPYDSCPQICVYCQRNWEIKNIKEALITDKRVNKALSWIEENKNIREVLVTGGDPLTLHNDYIEKIIKRLASIPHIERIRIGTRVLVTLPFRVDSGLLRILKRYHRWGKREICIITHFEHSSEITPEAIRAVEKIKKTGINVYNQQVFTYYNSRKFETAYLRRCLKLAGIDPYYSFNAKGKEETEDFRVPIARIEQERHEEARLLPGIVRTDEPVFNVPKLGKSHLRAWQDHEIIMVLPDGKRLYRFYPWVSRLVLSDTYIYKDVSIYDYLERLKNDGEELESYSSIWYYM